MSADDAVSAAPALVPAKGAPSTIEVTILFTAFIAATYGFGLYLFAGLMPDMRRDIGFDYGDVGVMTGGVQLGFLSFALLSGLLAPRIGMRRTVILSVFLTALCCLLIPMASSTIVLGVLLTLMGAAAASVWVPMVAVTKELVPQAHLGKALGLMSSGTAYGIFNNGLILPVVLPVHGWQYVWISVGAIALTVAVWGTIRIGLSDHTGNGNRPADAAPEPARWSIFKRPVTTAVLAMMFLNGLSCMPIQNYLLAMMREQLGYSIEQAATIMSLNGLVGMFSGIAIGALADRITIKWAMVVTYAILSVAALCFLWHPNLTAIYVGTVAFGIAFYAIFGLVPAYVGVVFTAVEATLVFGVGNVLLGLGGALGNSFGGLAKKASGTFDVAFMLVLVAAVATLVLSLWMRAERSRSVAAIVPSDAAPPT